MSILLIEAFSGMSGDMFLGALAGLNNAYEELGKFPEKFGLPDGSVHVSKTVKNGIVCKQVNVIDLNDQHKSHNHRHLTDIFTIIDKASITEKAKEIAKEIFLIIGRSESKIHNIPLENIHFHEISGVDSIIDILGCAVLIDKLEIKRTYATPVCTGYGFVKTQHGILPVPAPATADILQGIPTYPGKEEGEKVTPTGAAILKYLDPCFKTPPLIKEQIAYGPGSKDFDSPNVLRISLCEEVKKPEETFILETNIDDMTGEFLGLEFQEDLFKHGANDFYFNSVHMKKGRSGILLSCLVSGEHLEKLSSYIFENTTTIGLRYFPVEMNRLQRENKTFSTIFGEVNVKITTTPSGKKKAKIEYNDLKKIQENTGIPLSKLQLQLLKELKL